MKKDVVVGIGEIGKPIMKLISKSAFVVGYDINPKVIDKKSYTKYESMKTFFLHICIPFTKKFHTSVISLFNKFRPECIVIHSTVGPYTTKKLQELLPIPVIYSATRGVHKRMFYDLKRYTKFYAIESDAPRAKWASSVYSKLMKKCGVKTKKMSSPITLELAKILVDTSYYGWLINYAQLSNVIATQHNADYNEMWTFADEIHKFLGNRPKMFPSFIGGHCIIPNVYLINDKILHLIGEINSDYAKILKKRQSNVK